MQLTTTLTQYNDVGLISGQRHRRCTNIKQTLVERFVFAGWLVNYVNTSNELVKEQ